MKKLLTIFSLLIAVVYAQNCDEDTHSININDSWLSCDIATNPNEVRGNTHWVMYDLGYIYQLKETTFWNFNQSGQTNNGMKNIVIDYSLDGINWQEATTFQLSEANGTSTYTGENGPNLTGLEARYILITALDTWGGTCAGLSEVKFNVDKNTNIYEITEDDTYLTVSPNPASQSIKISTDFEYNELLIISSTGTEILRTTPKQYLDVSYLPNGVYFLKLVNKSNLTKTTSFVKKPK